MENATITTLTAQFPLVEDLIALKETTWLNPRTTTLAEGLPYVGPQRAGLLNPNWSPFRQCRRGWRKNLANPFPARCC